MGWLDVLFLLLVVPPTALSLVLLADTLRGLGRLPRLEDVALEERESWPLLSIVTPACDEERAIEGSIRSMLGQDYPALEVVAVDDRSTDLTGEILDRVAAEDARLGVSHVTELREGWLGKLNALSLGAERARGDWLLFADADAELAPTALRKAVAHATAEGLDLLSLVPTVHGAGLVADSAFSLALAMLSFGGRLQKVPDPASPAIAAGGAFVLVRREAFLRTPGLEWLKLEVADDFGLCLLLKTHGGRCAIANGRSELSIAWYRSFGEMTRAMQKSFFAIIGGFSAARTTAVAAAFAWLALFPLAVLLPVETPALLAVALLGEGALAAAMVAASLATRRPAAGALLPPVGALAMAFMIFRAGLVGLREGGIRWRGVLYPTGLLRGSQRVRVTFGRR